MPKKTRKKITRRRLLSFFIIFTILLVLEAGYFAVKRELSTRLPYRITIAGTDYSLIERAVATSAIEGRVNEFLQQPLHFQTDTKSLEVQANEINLRIEVEHTVALLSDKVFSLRTVALPVTLDEKRLREILLSQDPDLEYAPTDAKVFVDANGEFKILPEKFGRKTDFALLAAQIREQVGMLVHHPINIHSKTVPPQQTADKFESFRDQLVMLTRENLILKNTDYERYEINLADRISWFDLNTNGDLSIFLKKEAFEYFVEHELNPLVAELPHDVQIGQTIEGVIEFEGVAKSGQTVDTAELQDRIIAALESDSREIWIPFRALPAPVKSTRELADLGINELIGEAVTAYTGSPANRQHNISVAAVNLSGLLIAPEEEFSFIGSLGPVTSGQGYKRELIIKEGDVTPEIGGGVCQVSTTFFRTALDTGLPITRYQPHTLKVHYYDPPGLDATVYPGQADLRFINDTGQHILIQAVVEGASLRVNFFGTADGRDVKLAGPFYPNGDPVTDLRRAGLRMFWTRKIVAANGEEKEERYNATYKLMPEH
ncbi:MAG: VanW family protein [Patescibacteria group bacterium]